MMKKVETPLSMTTKKLIILAIVPLILLSLCLAWWILWTGGPLSKHENKFHESVQTRLPKVEDIPVKLSWNELTAFDWVKACRINTYDTNLQVEKRIGTNIDAYPLNWWASTDGYQGIAFADKENIVKTIRIPRSLLTEILSNECYLRSSEVTLSLKSVNGYRKLVLIIR